ncbi:MAG: zinc metallopeptidase [Clostridiales bacterium]|jgi:Zn-dependent membrane protease YugP|nr:zinc metallopeptidase [Clostridiales bacterium]
MYFDITYIILVLPAVIFSLWASAKVNGTYRKYKNLGTSSGMTGAQAARLILDRNGLRNVRIMKIDGQLTDHYDPRNRTISLSQDIHDGSSAVAVGIAAHEVGHAIQHAESYTPLKIRNAIIPVTSIGSQLSIPLVLLGLFLSRVSQDFILLAYGGIALFGLVVVFQLLTLPTEFNASSRALAKIGEYGILREDETKPVKKVLSAAAMTYVAALAVSLVQLLRLLLIVSGGRRRS